MTRLSTNIEQVEVLKGFLAVYYQLTAQMKNPATGDAASDEFMNLFKRDHPQFLINLFGESYDPALVKDLAQSLISSLEVEQFDSKEQMSSAIKLLTKAAKRQDFREKLKLGSLNRDLQPYLVRVSSLDRVERCLEDFSSDKYRDGFLSFSMVGVPNKELSDPAMAMTPDLYQDEVFGVVVDPDRVNIEYADTYARGSLGKVPELKRGGGRSKYQDKPYAERSSAVRGVTKVTSRLHWDSLHKQERDMGFDDLFMNMLYKNYMTDTDSRRYNELLLSQSGAESPVSGILLSINSCVEYNDIEPHLLELRGLIARTGKPLYLYNFVAPGGEEMQNAQMSSYENNVALSAIDRLIAENHHDNPGIEILANTLEGERQMLLEKSFLKNDAGIYNEKIYFKDFVPDQGVEAGGGAIDLMPETRVSIRNHGKFQITNLIKDLGCKFR